MKILKGLSITIIGIIALLLIVAIFLPSEYKVERSIEISQPVGIVYGYVADFNNFHDWNPWTPMEPSHKFEVVGDSGGVGQKYSWEGEIVGTGDMTFLELRQKQLIKSDINFHTPNEGKGIVDWAFDGDMNETIVSWSITGEAGYPMGRYFGLMMDEFLGKNFEDGVSKLKEECEKIVVPTPLLAD